MAGYVGNIPVPQSVREDQSFTATAGQTTFNTLGYTDGNRIKVTLNGVLLEGGGVDYTATNGSDVVLTVAAVIDDIVRFETFNEVQLVSNTSTSPIIKTNLTLKNDTEEDTDGGRESTVIFQGEQSGGEITTLAQIEAAHDGTADDEKGDLIFRTNDGSDGTAPTERLRIDSEGHVGINIVPTNTLVVSETTTPTIQIKDGQASGTRVSGKLHIGEADTLGISIENSTTSYNDNCAMVVKTSPASGTLTTRLRIDEHGIKFGSDTAAANALDDYETGTFTMTANGVSGGARGAGIYTKIGEVVHFQWYSGAMTVTSSTPVLTGLPFTSTDPFNGGAYAGFTAYHNTYVTNANTGYINLNSTSLYFTALGNTGGPTISTGSNIYVMVTGTYYTNA